MAKSGKICRIAIGVLISPVILICLLALLLYFPPFQNWAVKQAADYASSKTGMEISIQHIHLAFPIDLKVDGVKILQPNDSLPGVKDTVANVSTTIVKLQARPLLDGDFEVDELHLRKLNFNTTHFISDCRLKGKADEMLVRSHGVSIPKQNVLVNEALLKTATVDILLSDTAKKDTTKTETLWKIVVQKLHIHNSDVTVHLPGDTLIIGARMGNADIDNTEINLHDKNYSFQRAKFANTTFRYDNSLAPRLKRGFDYNHICMQKLGLNVTQLLIDTTYVKAKTLGLTTESSRLFAENVYFPFNTFAAKQPGSMIAKADVHLGRADIKTFCPTLPREVNRFIPWEGIEATIDFKGNLQKFTADVEASALTPHYTKLKAWVEGINTSLFTIHSSLTYGTGRLWLDGNIDIDKMAYSAKLSTDRFPLQYFVAGLAPISAKVAANGHGTDFFSKKTYLKADASVQALRYSRFTLAGTTMKAEIKKGWGHASVHCWNRLIKADAKADALMDFKNIKASLDLQLKKADLYAMKLVKAPLTTSMHLNMDFATDLNDHYEANGLVSDVLIIDTTMYFTPEDLQLNLFTNRDTTFCNFNSGDMILHLNAKGGYKHLLKTSDILTAEFKRQLKNMSISADSLQMVLPCAHLQIHSQKENFFARYLQSMDINFKEVYADISTSPKDGVSGFIHLDSLIAVGKQIDLIQFDIDTDSTGFEYSGQIQNYPGNPQYAFNALFDGRIHERGSDINLKLYDGDDVLGINVGLNASIVNVNPSQVLKVTLKPDNLILGYQHYTVNADNYLMLGKGNRLWANMKLRSSHGTGISITTDDYADTDTEDDSEEKILQDLTLSINDLNLQRLSAALPYIPAMSGTMNGDFHAVLTDKNLTVSSSSSVDSLVVLDTEIGNVSTDFIYSPRNDGSHAIDAIINRYDKEVGEIVGVYTPGSDGEKDKIDANFNMNLIPLNMVNAFIPQQLIGLQGYGSGKLHILGSVDEPVVQGTVETDSARIQSVPYGIDLALEDTKLEIKNSRVNIDEARLLTHNSELITLKGYVDFADISNMYIDMRAGGKNVMLVDSKQKRKSEVWGKAYTDIFAHVSGKLDNLKITGLLNVLSTSDMTYMLKDSPINTDNQLEELVQFTDFNSKDTIMPQKAKPTNLKMDLNINIETGAHIFCALNATRTNYVDVTGSGSLKMGYNSGNISLRGRYEISSGEMKYSIAVIPLKTFNIQSGSFIEFKGDVMNPTLNITALETVTSPVSDDGSATRNVTFNCGVKITNTLEKMGFEFIIDAPSDVTVQSLLQTRSVEDRAKMAVTMLTTGLYYDANSTKSLSATNALSSYLSSQISNITNNALKTIDMSVGLNNTIDEQTGSDRTDYSFKFSKRFWGNRFKVSIGGKVSSGSTVQKNNNFLDNVSVEYRITQKSDLNLKAFYERQVYDYLEGFIDKYGAGVVWKKSVPSFIDFFKPSTYKTKREESK